MKPEAFKYGIIVAFITIIIVFLLFVNIFQEGDPRAIAQAILSCGLIGFGIGSWKWKTIDSWIKKKH